MTKQAPRPPKGLLYDMFVAGTSRERSIDPKEAIEANRPMILGLFQGMARRKNKGKEGR
jgi:hypothetical protein